ncbi:MAG: hypothetical protein ACXAC5_04500 [Promethearchaeota archaeon]|jgi:uroporphyrinogen-III synthase
MTITIPFDKLLKILRRGKEIAYSLRELQQGKLEVVDAKYLLKLEEEVKKLRKDNDKMMMTFYSASAARAIMDEMREILDCPVGHDIVEAVKKLKENGNE